MGEQSPNSDYRKKLAIDLFNQTWQLLDKEKRSEDEDEMMLQQAYASCFLWREVGTALHQARGEWMISHVAVILGRTEAALHHARRSLKLCEQNGFGDFDLAFAYEAVSRAMAANGDNAESEKYFSLAEDAGRKISEKGDKDLFFESLKAGPWFGIR